ncbi:G2/mitotic-specific cyclin-B [Cladobotryum mycophilum]|uniref:G2/mitotic-specific cyclin-B n=1 Tax=Cladobotryum mycophilum TaxID=491253 RepID=A0ABR0S733_9HYPO
MPPGRPAVRSRLVSNENDENSATTRMTRAKAAALSADDVAVPSKGALQSKKTAVSTTTAGSRRRAALGDVSNLNKGEGAEGKKAATGKSLAKTGGVTKPPRTNNRVPAPKESKKADPPKKSGAGAITASQKRKEPSAPVKEEEVAVAETEPIVKRHRPEHVDDTKTDGTKSAPAKSELSSKDADFLVHVKDLDSEDLDDPLMVAEYATEIFEYLRDLEVQSIPNPEYMSHQDDLEWKTRGILIDWLIEVHTRFHLLPETLFLAVNVIDRFLSEKVVQLDRLQLVGITAMFIASKYEEVLSPHVENFKKIADDGFSETEILSAERFILSTLSYDLSYPNPMNFLRRVSKADNYDIQSRTIGKYLTEISLLDHRFMAYRPSHTAAAAMYLARLMLDRGEWDETLTYYAGYSEEEVEPVVHLMVDYLARPIIHEAFFKKYASKKFLKASILARQWAKKNAPLFGIEDLELSLDQLS